MKLYIAHVGFYDEEFGMYELHSNIFVVAEDIQSAKKEVKNKDIFISKKMHIDGIQEILNVDGYEISISETKNSNVNKVFGYDAVKNIG